MTGGPTDEELAEKLATLDIQVEGYRRPVLLETVIHTGMEALRPGAKSTRNVLVRLISEIKRLTARADQADVLERRVKELERKLAEAQAVLTEEELGRVRTYYKYGMTVPEVAKAFGVDENRIRRALKMRERPLERKQVKTPVRSRKRSLEL